MKRMFVSIVTSMLVLLTSACNPEASHSSNSSRKSRSQGKPPATAKDDYLDKQTTVFESSVDIAETAKSSDATRPESEVDSDNRPDESMQTEPEQKPTNPSPTKPVAPSTTDTSPPADSIVTVNTIRQCSKGVEGRKKPPYLRDTQGVYIHFRKWPYAQSGQSLPLDLPEKGMDVISDIYAKNSFSFSVSKVPDGQYQMMLCQTTERDNWSDCFSDSFIFDFGTGELGRFPYLEIKAGSLIRVCYRWGFDQHTLSDRYCTNGSTIGGFNVTIADNLGEDASDPLCDILASPLIIDLSGDGIRLTPQSSGVDFNVDGKPGLERISWMTKETSMLLALDRNNNGNIDDGTELFGNFTLGPDGSTAENGFAALAKYDINRDNLINDTDPIYSQLRLWSDKNRNGKTEDGELSSLPERGIVSIDVDWRAGWQRDQHGNLTKERSVVNLRDGSMRMIFDVWFKVGRKPD